MTRRTGLHYAVGPHGGIALLDARRFRGRWRIFDHISARLWTEITSGTPVDQAVDGLVAQLTRQGSVTDARVRKDLAAVLQDLTRSDLLVPAQRNADRPTPSVRFTTVASGSFAVRIAAQAGLALALTLLRCTPLRVALAVARAATWLPGRPADVAEAEAAHAAVRHAGRAWPGRAACLEESLGTFLACALTGRRTRWVLGAAFLPQSAHAWVEAEGSIIGQAPEDRVWAYIPVLEVERPN